MTTTDLTAVLTEDHRTLDRLCTELDLGQGSPENRKDLTDHLIAELIRHAVAEESLLPQESELAEAERLMRQLEDVGPQEIRFERLLGALIRAVRQHVQEEGPAAIRELRSSRSAAQLRELGEAVLDARDAAASLPHPATADRVPAAQTLRRGQGLVERARAALSR